MIKVVVDTNILVSAAIGKGYSFLIVDKIFSDELIELCVSETALDEFERVIQYSRLIKKENFKIKAKSICDNIKIFGSFYSPHIAFDILKDKSDNKFPDLAVEAKADYLITGNYLDFNIETFQTVKIVSPKTFWELYIQNNL